jgi:hypothetical protein
MVYNKSRAPKGKRLTGVEAAAMSLGPLEGFILGRGVVESQHSNDAELSPPNLCRGH